MKVSVYVITGILDSGKTTWINYMLSSASNRKERCLVVQLEQGDIGIRPGKSYCRKVQISMNEFSADKEKLEKKLYECIMEERITTVYIEWSGIIPFEELEEVMLRGRLKRICEMKQVFYIVKEGQVLQAVKGLGTGPVSQLRNADVLLYIGKLKKEEKKLLQQISEYALIYSEREARENYREIVKEKKSPYTGIMLVITFFIVLGLLFPIFQTVNPRWGKIIIIFVGLLLQGIPFLLIGVLISSFIQIYIPRETILRWFPKNPWSGLTAAVLAGFCLPVCDCASIPIFKGLVKKGVPLYAAVTFMFAAPVINPVVMLSTFYAFNGNLQVVILRVLLGIIVSVGVGIVISLMTNPKEVYKRTWEYESCNCGCDMIRQDEKIGMKLAGFFRHSQLEFLDVGRYLLLGTFFSAFFQVIQSEHSMCVCEWPLAVRIFLMMLLAFLLSLCSSADAIVCQTFVSEFSLVAVMGFLVFGPMLDIKNVLMLQSGFSKKFIVKLCAVTFLICFVVILVAAVLWKGGI